MKKIKFKETRKQAKSYTVRKKKQQKQNSKPGPLIFLDTGSDNVPALEITFYLQKKTSREIIVIKEKKFVTKSCGQSALVEEEATQKMTPCSAGRKDKNILCR